VDPTRGQTAAGSVIPRPRTPRVQPSTSLTDRPRLVSQLVSASSADVLVVSAPAGTGKSVLARQWAAVDPRPHVNVRIATWDDDPATLVGRLLDALEPLGPGVDDIRTTVTAVEPRFSGTLLPGLASVVSSRWAPFVLVVDDIHVLTDRSCADVLDVVCSSLPDDSQVLLLSRAATPAWLSRSRAEGRLLELGPDDLAFTEAEVAQFAADRSLHLSEHLVAELRDRTEGWAVGLYLASLALQASGDPAALDRVGSSRMVVDYVRTQVLDHLDVDARNFLRRSSILEELSPDLCDAVLERDDSAAMLRSLERRVQLVAAVDAEGTAYRCHHLLGEALVIDLTEHEPAAIPLLHARAAKAYLERGAIDSCIRHAELSGDLALASSLIWTAMPLAVGTGRPDSLERWLAPLTEAQRGLDPWLTLASAWLSLQHGDADALNGWLLKAEAHAGRDWMDRIREDEFAATLGMMFVVLGRGGLDETLRLVRLVPQGLPAWSPWLTPLYAIGAMAAALRDRRDESESLARLGLELSRALAVPTVEADILSWNALEAWCRGDIDEAQRIGTHLRTLVIDHHLDRLTTAGLTMTMLGLLDAIGGRRDEATRNLGSARRLILLMRGIVPWFRSLGPVLLARAHHELGDDAAAHHLLEEARTHLTADLDGTRVIFLLEETSRLVDETRRTSSGPALLTAAEMRVLHYMPSHLTYPQIGEHLFLSANTVKTHALSIYRKLDVTSRNDAVVRARTLGLIESVPVG
jgi:LuxR family maltose regulon positive regulatory protein